MTSPTPGPEPVVTVVADERPAEPAVKIDNDTGKHVLLASTATATQVANPHRTTYRSVIQLLLALATALPQIVPIITGSWSPEWLVTAGAQVLLVQAAIVRIMALPGVDYWLQVNLPWFSALRTETIASPR